MSAYIKIDASRDTYSAADAVEQTMTAGELIRILEDYDEDTPVILSHDNGYTYGKVLPHRYAEEVAYSIGMYGTSGKVLRNTETGELFKITARSTNLFKY